MLGIRQKQKLTIAFFLPILLFVGMSAVLNPTLYTDFAVQTIGGNGSNENLKLLYSAPTNNLSLTTTAFSGDVYIHSDGSISPAGAPITTSDNFLYTLTDDISGTLYIQRSNIVLNGAGHSISFSLSRGIYMSGLTNVTIANITVVGPGSDSYSNGLYITGSASQITVVNSSFHSCSSGIYSASTASNLTVVNSSVVQSLTGVFLASSNNNITNNVFTDTRSGVYLSFSVNSTVKSNTFVNSGLFVLNSRSNYVTDNTVNGKPLVYIESTSNIVVTSPAGQVILVDSYNITVKNVDLSNTMVGIELENSTKCTMYNNTLHDSQFGVYLYESDMNTLYQNNFSDNYYGIYMHSGDNNTIIENVFTNDGIFVLFSFNTTARDNVINDKPLVFLEGVANVTIENVGQVILVNTENITVKNSEMLNVVVGIELIWSTNCLLVDNEVTSKRYGIYLDSSPQTQIYNNLLHEGDFGVYINSQNIIVVNNTLYNHESTSIYIHNSNNTVTNNTIYDSNSDGIYLSGSATQYNLVTGNRIYSIASYGITLMYGAYNTIENNIISDTPVGIYGYRAQNNTFKNNELTGNQKGISVSQVLYSHIENNIICNNSEDGLALKSSDFNVISGNIFLNNSHGISLDYSDNNTITDNTIIKNNVGAYIHMSQDNKIYNNKFIENDIQVNTDVSVNAWDNGYPSGGNYWSDYTGTDNYRGTNQDESGSDGIGDTPYSINANNNDSYPLVDTTAPTLVYLKRVPSTDSVFQKQTVTVKIAIDDDLSGLKSLVFSYRFDNGTWVNVTAEVSILKTEYQFTIPGREQETFVEFMFVATDYSNNSLSQVYNYRVIPDVTPPIMTYIEYLDAIANGTNALINVTVQDDASGIKAVILSYRVNRGDWVNITTASVYNNIYHFAIPGQSAGVTVHFKIYVIDNTNNTFVSPEYTYTVFLIETVPPVILSVEYLPNVNEGTNALINVTAEDEHTGIRQVILSYKVGSGVWVNVTSFSVNNNTYQFLIPSMVAGTTVEFKIIAIDNCGNVNVSSIYSYTVVPVAETPNTEFSPVTFVLGAASGAVVVAIVIILILKKKGKSVF